MPIQSPDDALDPLSAPAGGPYAWYTLAVLILAYTFSFIDRQILTLLVGPIRASLHITDFQLSLLHGLAFALFYTVLGIPIGRLVDRRRRTAIISGGIAVWSIMTALCGLARSFGQLFIARIGVGVGEAALSPGAYSLLSDRFPPRELPRAINIYTGAAYFGAGIATIAGGALIALMPALTLPFVGRVEAWQSVFIAVGLPGLLVALLVLSLKEPVRHDIRHDLAEAQPRIATVIHYLWTRKAAFGLVILGYSIFGIIWNGALAWLPSFLMRTHGWDVADVGLYYGLTIMIGGTIGVVLGGSWTVRLRAAGHMDSNIRIGLYALALAAPLGIATVLAPTGEMALGGILLFLTACAMPWGGAAAALQEITPNRMRGQVSAIYLFFLSLLGMGFGPTIVAGFTDHLFANDMAVGRSIAVTILLAAPVSATLLLLSRRGYCAILARHMG